MKKIKQPFRRFLGLDLTNSEQLEGFEIECLFFTMRWLNIIGDRDSTDDFDGEKWVTDEAIGTFYDEVTEGIKGLATANRLDLANYFLSILKQQSEIFKDECMVNLATDQEDVFRNKIRHGNISTLCRSLLPTIAESFKDTGLFLDEAGKILHHGDQILEQLDRKKLKVGAERINGKSEQKNIDGEEDVFHIEDPTATRRMALIIATDSFKGVLLSLSPNGIIDGATDLGKAASFISMVTNINASTVRKALEATYRPNASNSKNNPLRAEANREMVDSMLRKIKFKKGLV